MFKKTIQLITLGLFLVGCKTIEIEQPIFVDINGIVRGHNIGGYDSLMTTDWEIVNISEYTITGWEIEVEVVFPDTFYVNDDGPVEINDTIPSALYFQHEIDISPDSSRLFENMILFRQNAETLFPVFLETNAKTLRSWKILEARGIIDQN
jgi:hypothetical protein